MAKKNEVSVYILLDRSGSMGGSKWETAIGSINSYVQTLRNEKVSAKVTVAAFDSEMVRGEATIRTNAIIGGYSRSQLAFNLMREEVAIKNFKDLEMNELSPRGGTPLYDATAKLLNLADKNNAEKTVVLIMTDGEENESKVYNLESIRDRIATCQNRGWEVIFLGQEFNVETTARSFGLNETKFLNADRGNINNNMRFYASSTAAYASGQAIDTTKANI